jgi:hypothetical protein
MQDGFKICTCGKRYTLEEWRKLPRTGVVDIERDPAAPPRAPGESPIEPFELRTCPVCRSTVSKVIPYPGGSEYPPPCEDDDD